VDDTPQLLHRFYASLHASNPSLLTSTGKRYTIAPPSIHREGNKKSIFANVTDICKRMHRQPEHVIQFLFAEMGTTGSVDGAGRLVIKGRFQQKQVENVLRRYIGMLFYYFPLVDAGVDRCGQWNTLLAKHANHPIRCSRRRIVSSSCRASHAVRDALLMLSRAVFRPRSGREARTRQVEVLYNSRTSFWSQSVSIRFSVLSSSITITLAVLSSISHKDRCS